MRISYTKIKMYMECPAKKRYRYDERRQTPPSDAARRGTDYHKTIEGALGDLHEPTPLPPNLSFYQDYIGRLRSLGAKAEFKFGVDKQWNSVGWDSPDAWIIGVADVWLPSIPTAHVQDWKTGKIYDDHHLQGEFYATALFQVESGIVEVKATFVYTDLKKEQSRTYHRDNIASLRNRWTARIERMERDTECVPTPSFKCGWCPYSKAKGGPCRF